MSNLDRHKIEIAENGFTTIENIYSTDEVESILSAINQADTAKETFRKSADLFAVRQFLKEVPTVCETVFNHRLKSSIDQLFGNDYFVVKSIYFDKPGSSNWFVSYHQDLTISVDKKLEIEHYKHWSLKQNQYSVQPPIDILENNFTIRIHLDDTDANNGALRVIPKSHLKKVYRPETIDWTNEIETTPWINKGGIMIMRPLLLHSSSKTTNNKKRRVIHIEFSNTELPSELNWSERFNYKR